MRQKTALVGCIVFTFSVSAFAAGEDTCRKESHLDRYIGWIADWDSSVPGVPPSEAAFLDKELEAARQRPSAEAIARFSLLMKNPYYYAYNLHNAFTKVTKSTREALSRSKPQDRMVGAASAMLDAAEAQRAMNDYANANPGPGTPPPLSSSAMTILAIDLQGYIACEAKAIP